MEELKDPTNMFEPDDRWSRFKLRNRTTGVARSLELQDLHREAQTLLMPEHIPPSIRDAFTVALNLWLYGWFHYPFCTMAYLHVMLLIEPAIKARGLREGFAQAEHMSLKSLLDAARAHHWYRIDAIRHVQRLLDRWNEWDKDTSEGERQARLDTYFQELPDRVANMRNLLAHGAGFMLMLPFEARLAIEMDRDFIVELYSDLASGTERAGA